MSQVKTECSNCVFALMSKDHQSGCSLNRDEVFKITDTTEDNFYILDRFCNTYRPEEWIQNLDLEEQMDIETAALNEVRPRMGVFIRLDTAVPNAIERLDETMESLAKINGDVSYVAVITDKVEYNDEIWEIFIKYLGEDSGILYHIVQLEREIVDFSRVIDEAFTHAQNGWIYVTTSGETVHKDTLDILHKRLNIELAQLMMVEPYDGFNGLMFPAFIFKFLNGNKTKMFQNEETSSLSFMDKLREADKRTDKKSIFTWEEFYAS